MSTTPDLPMLPNGSPAEDYTPRFIVYAKDQMQTYARTHADNCIRALTAEISELKAEIARFIVSTVVLRDERDAALTRAEKAEARAGSVPAGWKLVPLEPTLEMLASVAAWQRTQRHAWQIDSAQSMTKIWEHLLAAAPSAPSTPPDEATSRAQFEAWHRKHWPDASLMADRLGNYRWQGWQAARTQGDAA